MVGKIKLENFAIKPRKATPGSAAYDVFLPLSVKIQPGRQIIALDFRLEIPCGYEAKIEPRSGFSAKGMEDSRGGRRDADVIAGKIDSDYRGVVGVIINSYEMRPFIVSRGTRIAQMTFYKVEDAELEETSELTDTLRGEGGFGHTGV